MSAKLAGSAQHRRAPWHSMPISPSSQQLVLSPTFVLLDSYAIPLVRLDQANLGESWISNAFFRGSHTTTWVTWGLSKSYSQAALVPSSKVPISCHALPG